jgi:hypothetical protein
MSLRGYKKKSKPALWLTAFPSQAVKTMTKAEKVARIRKFIRPVSKKRQATSKEYRDKAQEFIKAAIGRGETCPVVARIPELRDGMMYGHPISARLNEVHHKRGRRGELLLDDRHWMAVSKQGHRWMHEHPNEARGHGWMCELGEWNNPDKS